MSDKPERIWAVAEDLGPHFYGETYWETAPTIAGTPYVREDLHVALQGRIQFLEKALEQLRATAEVREYFLHEADAQDPDASWFELTLDAPITDVEHLAQYLKEKKEE